MVSCGVLECYIYIYINKTTIKKNNPKLDELIMKVNIECFSCNNLLHDLKFMKNVVKIVMDIWWNNRIKHQTSITILTTFFMNFKSWRRLLQLKHSMSTFIIHPILDYLFFQLFFIRMDLFPYLLPHTHEIISNQPIFFFFFKLLTTKKWYLLTKLTWETI